MPFPRRALIVTTALLLIAVAGIAREASADSWYFRTILHDDFSNRETGILPDPSDGGNRYDFSYEAGEYVVRRRDATMRVMLTPQMPQTTGGDMVVTVDVRFPERVYGEYAGLWCRRTLTDGGKQSGYNFTFDTYSRSFQLVRSDSDQIHDLAIGRSATIALGQAWNRIQLSCIGPTITATINGIRVASVEDFKYLSGRLTLITNTYSFMPDMTYEIHFDNLDVSVPTDLPYHLTVPPNDGGGVTP